MIRNKCRRAGASKALLIILAAITNLGAQTVSKMEIKGSPSRDVTLAVFDLSLFPTFKDVFDQKNLTLAHAAFVVTNGSAKAIIGIGVVWTFADSVGHESTYTNRTHSFMVPGLRPLALPHGRLLVAPGTFVSEDILLHSQGGVLGFVPGDRTISRFSSAFEMNAEVDSIIFEDGEVVGPDRLGLVGAIRDRRDAAQEVLRQVEQAQGNGKDPADVLREIIRTPVPRDDQITRLEVVLAGELLRARRLDSHFQYLKSIPAPPLFYRKDGGPIWR